MQVAYRYAFPAMWLSWVVYWWIASRDVKITVQRESLPSRLSHIVPLAIAVLLYSLQRVRIPLLGERFLPLTEWSFWIGGCHVSARCSGRSDYLAGNRDSQCVGPCHLDIPEGA